MKQRGRGNGGRDSIDVSDGARVGRGTQTGGRGWGLTCRPYQSPISALLPITTTQTNLIKLLSAALSLVSQITGTSLSM